MGRRQEWENDDLLPEYDFSQGVCGKHFREYQQGYAVAITHPDGTQTVVQVHRQIHPRPKPLSAPSWHKHD